MSHAVLFVCPQCGVGRQLPPYAVEARVRCLACETSFRSEGFLFEATDWPRQNDPFLLAVLAAGMGRELSTRKWRLFACAVARTAFDWCRNPWFRDALQAGERWADEGMAPRGVKLCRTELGRVVPPSLLRQYSEFGINLVDWYGGAEHLNFQLRQEREQFAWVQLAQRCVNDESRLTRADLTEGNRAIAAGLLRDLLANPFLPLAWNHDWFTSTVRDLAAHIYTSRDFGAMPILADALQDAGCDDEQILAHCRGSKPHARGCWVLDAILGKS